MRWCRTAKHFDPLVFRHVFGFDYPPDPAVVPKLFPIPFFREYVSVMRSFGLEDTEDQDLEIPTMGADNKQTLTHFQLTL